MKSTSRFVVSGPTSLLFVVAFLAPVTPVFAQACDATKTPTAADCEFPGSSVCSVTGGDQHVGTCIIVSACVPSNGACAPGTQSPATTNGTQNPSNQGGSQSPTQTNGNNHPVGPSGTQSTGVTSLHNPLNNVNTLEDLLTAVLGAVISLGTIALVVALVWVGAQFVFAQGQEEKIRDARNALMWTVIGGLVLLGAQTISMVIQSTVGALQ